MEDKVFTGANFGIAPEHTAHRNSLEKNISDTFEQYGYNEVRLPMYEYYDVLKNAAQDFKDASIITFTDRHNGRTLVLRPDFTPLVCRMVAGYHKDYPMPIRMYYRGTVFHNVDVDKGSKADVYQVGCELYGAGELCGDIELFLCAKTFFNKINFSDYRFIVGDAQYIARLNELLGESYEDYTSILHSKNLYKLNDFVSSLNDKSEDLKQLIIKLPKLFGTKDTLEELLILSSFDQKLKERCEYTLKVFNMLLELGINSDKFIFDLSETRGLGYYTGISFEIIHLYSGALIGGGGRYDNLMKKFDLDYSACGMAVYLTELENLIEFGYVESEIDWIVIGGENLKKAEELRKQGYKVVFLESSENLDKYSSVVKSKNILITT